MVTRTDLLVLWLLPLSWLVHDGEESLTIEAWSHRWRRATGGDESSLRRRLVEMVAATRRRFTIAAVLVSSVVVGATGLGVLDPDGIGLLVYVTVLGGFFLHAFVHLAHSALLRGYVPGLVTAVVVVIPVSIVLYWWLLLVGLVDIRTATTSCVVGLVLFAPVVVGANRLSRRIERLLD